MASSTGRGSLAATFVECRGQPPPGLGRLGPPGPEAEQAPAQRGRGERPGQGRSEVGDGWIDDLRRAPEPRQGQQGQAGRARQRPEGRAEDDRVAQVPAPAGDRPVEEQADPFATLGWSACPSRPERQQGHRRGLDPGMGAGDPGPADDRGVVAHRVVLRSGPSSALRARAASRRPPIARPRTRRGSTRGAMANGVAQPGSGRSSGHAERAVGPADRGEPPGRGDRGGPALVARSVRVGQEGQRGQARRLDGRGSSGLDSPRPPGLAGGRAVGRRASSIQSRDIVGVRPSGVRRIQKRAPVEP